MSQAFSQWNPSLHLLSKTMVPSSKTFTHPRRIMNISSSSSSSSRSSNHSNRLLPRIHVKNDPEKEDDNEPLPEFDIPTSSSFNMEAEKYRQQAEQLKQQIRDLEEKLSSNPLRSSSSNNNKEYIRSTRKEQKEEEEENVRNHPLRNKRILVLGANGRLGSMICKEILRTHGSHIQELVAAVHFVGEASTRGWGRLSYEIGAEDGKGRIDPAWSMEDRGDATLEYTQEMEDYHLNKIRLVDVELLDPNPVRAICEDVDAVIFAATDFDGNRPRSISGFNPALLFRAVASPTKGRVEIEGLLNVLQGLTESNMNRIRSSRITHGDGSSSGSSSTNTSSNSPTQLVLVSMDPNAYENWETPFGEFNALKRQAEGMIKNDFPSLSSVVLQLAKFEDNFVEEGLDLITKYVHVGEDTSDPNPSSKHWNTKRRINRRDAAKAVVQALTNVDWRDKTVQVYTKN